MGRPKKQEIVLSDLEREELLKLAKSRTSPHGLVSRRRSFLLRAKENRTRPLVSESGCAVRR
jgi:hypothetical protein